MATTVRSLGLAQPPSIQALTPCYMQRRTRQHTLFIVHKKQQCSTYSTQCTRKSAAALTARCVPQRGRVRRPASAHTAGRSTAGGQATHVGLAARLLLSCS
eukprot:scaffold33672_cov18-Tisochrysis_lutea.AAC.5